LISPKFFDVIVVGAGTAGCYASHILAEKGFKVALLDRKFKDEIGEKVCGDAIGKHHFDNLGLSYPSGEELDGVFRGVKVYSPDEEEYVTVEGEGFAINRKAFGRRLLKMALDSGVNLYPNTHVYTPLLTKNFVSGVKCIDLSTHEKFELSSKVVVDASGFAAAVRSKLPSSWWINEKIDSSDTNICYREIVEIDGEYDTHYANIYLSKMVAPGGYWWIFPKKSKILNVGLGVQPTSNHPNPKLQFMKHIACKAEFKSRRIIHSGGGVVPTRRFLLVPVGNGIVAIGDAASTCNPIHGGGIGPSLISAKHASETIISALERNGVASMNSLWSYTRKYLADYGLKQVSLEILRIFLQKLSDEDLTFIFKRKLVSGEDINRMGGEGELNLKLVKKIGQALKLISRPTLLFKLKVVVDYMERVKKLCSNYPENSAEFPRWRISFKKLIESFKSKI